MSDENGAALARLLNECGHRGGPVFVHADLMRARCFVPMQRDRQALLQHHWSVLQRAADGRAVWTPCFHYDFTRTGHVDLRTAPCQVGPLGEFARQQPSCWRSTDPVFSVCGTGDPPEAVGIAARQVAFGPRSVFAELYRTDATLVFYGAPFRSATVIHYAEQLSGGPVYRYDKTFRGTVVDVHGTAMEVKYVYHVRPLGRHLDYDWPRLEQELEAGGLLRTLKLGNRVAARVASCRALVDTWRSQLSREPLALLDADSRRWVAPTFERLGRRFSLEDFEPNERHQVA